MKQKIYTILNLLNDKYNTNANSSNKDDYEKISISVTDLAKSTGIEINELRSILAYMEHNGLINAPVIEVYHIERAGIAATASKEYMPIPWYNNKDIWMVIMSAIAIIISIIALIKESCC